MRLLLLSLIVLTFSTPAHALRIKTCICGDPKPIEQESERAFAIFTGTVKEIRIGLGAHKRTKIKFDVHQSWKGARHETISVWAAGADLYSKAKDTFQCHYKFAKGQTYFVVAHRKKNQNGPATVTTCGNTRTYDAAIELILRMGEPTIKNTPPKRHKNAVER
jgi:hypothetical protein